MAKEQKRGNKEAKKPKKVKEAAVSVVSSFSMLIPDEAAHDSEIMSPTITG